MDGLDSPQRTLVCLSLLNGPTKDRENFREFTCSPAKTNIKLLPAWLKIYYVSYFLKKYIVGLFEKKLKQLFNQFSPPIVNTRVCSTHTAVITDINEPRLKFYIYSGFKITCLNLISRFTQFNRALTLFFRKWCDIRIQNYITSQFKV